MSGYRLRALMLALLMVCSALPARAEAPSAEAWRLAVSYVPASALPLCTWAEGEDVSIFHFEDALRNISYEVRVLDKLLTMQEVQMTALKLKGAAHATLPQEEIQAAIHATYPGAQLYGLYRQQAAGLYYYLAIFTQPEQGMFYAMQFDAQTGDLMNYRMKQAAPEEEGLLSLAQAIEIGAAHAGSDALADLTFTRQDGRYV
ncbi:MAG: hypothetical protein GX653_08745 [Clostridiales bacterium]|nr:hypothetical protein [Clostridiales bacterium]